MDVSQEQDTRKREMADMLAWVETKRGEWNLSNERVQDIMDEFGKDWDRWIGGGVSSP